MKKGIYLAAVVYVEGEDDPAHNFAPDAEQLVRDLIASGKSTVHPDWHAEVKKLEETDMPGEWD